MRKKMKKIYKILMKKRRNLKEKIGKGLKTIYQGRDR